MHTPTDEEVESANLFHSYRVGWTDGAGMKSMRPTYLSHEVVAIKTEYERGYGDGWVARQGAMQEAASRLNYTPNVLRIAQGVSS